MTIKYKNQWKSMSVNEEFWKEVLVGRTITDIVLTGRGVVALKLDNGENIRFTKESTIYIQQDVESEKEKSDDNDFDDEDIDDIIEKEPDTASYKISEIKQTNEGTVSLDYFTDKYSKATVSSTTADNIESDLRMLTHRQSQDRSLDFNAQCTYLRNLLFELHLKLK